jgi:hypothetical protein
VAIAPEVVAGLAEDKQWPARYAREQAAARNQQSPTADGLPSYPVAYRMARALELFGNPAHVTAVLAANRDTLVSYPFKTTEGCQSFGQALPDLEVDLYAWFTEEAVKGEHGLKEPRNTNNLTEAMTDQRLRCGNPKRNRR